MNSSCLEARLEFFWSLCVCLLPRLCHKCLQRPSARRVKVESPQRTFISWRRTVWYCKLWYLCHQTVNVRRAIVTPEHKSDHRYSYVCRYVETSWDQKPTSQIWSSCTELRRKINSWPGAIDCQLNCAMMMQHCMQIRHSFTFESPVITIWGTAVAQWLRWGDRGGTVVKVLCYKSECRWFDSRWCRWNFSLT